MPRLNEKEIRSLLETIPGWERKEESLTKTLTFKDFTGAIYFVNCVAPIAEVLDHHPDIDIRWNKVLMKITTHSKGGLTKRDFALAQKINELL